MIRRLAILGALYVAQGLPFGFFTQALPVRMRESGMSLEAVGLASLLAAPWALKWLFALVAALLVESPRRGGAFPLALAVPLGEEVHA